MNKTNCLFSSRRTGRTVKSYGRLKNAAIQSHAIASRCVITRLLVKTVDRLYIRVDVCKATFRKNSFLKRSEMTRVNEGSQFYLPPTHSSNGMNYADFCSPATAHNRTLAGTYFPSDRRQEAELAWVAGYTPPKDGHHPSTNRPIVRQPGIELRTIESQVQRYNH